MHFIFDLIRKILRGNLYNEPVSLWGNGHQSREIVHVQDFVSQLLVLAEVQNNLIVNIGAGCEYTIREFAQKICEITEYPFLKIQFDESKYVGAKSKVLCIERLRGFLPHYASISLDDGLRQTIDWFMQESGILLA